MPRIFRLLPGLCLITLCGCATARRTPAWIDVSGFLVDTSRATPAQVDAVLPTLRQQIAMLESAHLPEKVLAYFKGIPIAIDPRLTGMNGQYALVDGVWMVRARPQRWPPERAILLHELLHAYHHWILGQPAAAIESAFAEAHHEGVYPADFQNAYFLSNSREYFAVIGEVYLAGTTFRPPYSCAAVQKAQPGFIAYMAGLFGEHPCN